MSQKRAPFIDVVLQVTKCKVFLFKLFFPVLCGTTLENLFDSVLIYFFSGTDFCFFFGW